MSYFSGGDRGNVQQTVYGTQPGERGGSPEKTTATATTASAEKRAREETRETAQLASFRCRSSSVTLDAPPPPPQPFTSSDSSSSSSSSSSRPPPPPPQPSTSSDPTASRRPWWYRENDSQQVRVQNPADEQRRSGGGEPGTVVPGRHQGQPGRGGQVPVKNEPAAAAAAAAPTRPRPPGWRLATSPPPPPRTRSRRGPYQVGSLIPVAYQTIQQRLETRRQHLERRPVLNQPLPSGPPQGGTLEERRARAVLVDDQREAIIAAFPYVQYRSNVQWE